jgi:hypothetical protein
MNATKMVEGTIESVGRCGARVMVRYVDGAQSRIVEARALVGGRVLEVGWPTIAIVDDTPGREAA